MALRVAQRLVSRGLQERTTLALDRSTSSPAPTQEPPQNLSSGRQTGRRVAIKGRRGGSQREDIPKQAVRGTEEGLGRDAACSRYELVKQAYQSSSLPYGITQTGTNVAIQTRTRSSRRPQGCILAHPHTPAISKISSLRSKQKAILLQSHALWFKFGTKSLLQNDEGTGEQTPRRGGVRHHVSRRLADYRRKSRRMHRDGTENPQVRQEDGSSLQLEEVKARPHQHSGMARDGMEYHHRDAVTITREPREVSEEDSQGKMLEYHVTAAVGKPHRLAEPRLRGSSIRQATAKETNSRRARSFSVGESRFSNSSSQSAEIPPQVVVREATEHRGKVDARASKPHTGHGRLGSGLGISVLGGAPGTRPLGFSCAEEAHQLEGTPSDPPGNRQGKGVAAAAHQNTDRQYFNNVLHQQIGNIQVTTPTPSVREALSPGSREGPSSVCSTHTRQDQRMGRRSVPASDGIGSLDFEGFDLPGPHGEIRSARDRSLRISIRSQGPEVPSADHQDSSRRTRCLQRGLEQVEVDIPVPASEHLRDAPGHPASEVVSGQSASHRTAVEGPTLDTHPSEMVPRTVQTSGPNPGRDHMRGTDDILKFTRMEFLQTVLSRSLPEDTVKDIISGHRASTARQYQSSWKKFQQFLSIARIKEVSEGIFLQFASYLFHKVKLAIPTISAHLAAIADPLKFAFGLSPSARSLELMKASFFLQRPPKRKTAPTWALKKVLDLLSSRPYTEISFVREIIQEGSLLNLISVRVSDLGACSINAM